MAAKRQRSDAWAAAVLALVWLAAAGWYALREAAAQDPAEQPRERVYDMSPAQRREKILSMSPVEKERLLEDKDRLAKLDAARRKQLHDLVEQVEEDPLADELLQVMHRYYDWLRAHPEAQLELAGLSPEKRVEKIKELLLAEGAEARAERPFGSQPFPRGDARRMSVPLGGRGGILRGEDTEGVLKWQEKYVKHHLSELLKKISSPFREQLEKQLEGATDELRRYEVLGMILLRWRLENPDAEAPLNDDDLKDLRAGLSEATRSRLNSLPAREQWQIASNLIYRFMLSRAAARDAMRLSPVVSDEELAEFFQNKISAEARARLLKQPPERIARDLLDMYLAAKLGQRPDGPGGLGGGGKRGDSRGSRRGPGAGPFDFPPAKKESPAKPEVPGKPEPRPSKAADR